MKNGLSKKEDADRAEHVANIKAARTELDLKISDANEAIAAANAERDRYNEVLEAARGFAQDIGNEIDSYISERSEAWQEGERGEAYAEFRDTWQNWSPDDLAEFEAIEIDDGSSEGDPADELENLPNEAE